MSWVAYAIAWLAAAAFWSLAAASGIRRSPVEAMPYALLAMGSAAVMGVGVWHLTKRVAWNWRSAPFYLAHVAALLLFSTLYTSSSYWPDLVRGHIGAAIAAFHASPIVTWNLLMGSWLYLMIAGLSYAIRAHHLMREQEAAAATARVLAQHAQLAALRAQINPHFLFNALHSVGALVATDRDRADLALEQLGDLLRYTLRSGDRVLLADEWKFTQDYLAFEQLRLGDRLTLSSSATAAALAAPVPPLILQPLVENAVRHGIADRRDGGRIDLRARVDDGHLVLHVSDDGNGNANESNDDVGGLGLTSIRQRLAATYGDRATVTIERDRGFSVTITLPADASGAWGSAA